jgi:hypothetical protein
MRNIFIGLLTSTFMKTLVVPSIGCLAVLAVFSIESPTPGFAQAYCACWGTGNVSDTPLLEMTNGAYGWAMSVPPQSGAASGPVRHRPGAGQQSRRKTKG